MRTSATQWGARDRRVAGGVARRRRASGMVVGAALALVPVVGWAAPEEEFWQGLAKAAGGVSLGVLILALLALCVAFKAGRVAMSVLLAALRPGLARRAREVVVARPVLAFLLGLANGLPGLLVLLILLGASKRAPLLFLLFLAAAAALMAILCLGLAGVYGAVGQRLGGRGVDEEWEPGDIWRGGAAFETATLLPLLGQGVSLVAMAMALGGGVLALFSGCRKTKKMAEDA